MVEIESDNSENDSKSNEVDLKASISEAELRKLLERN